jgi:hypothetical protein
MIVSFAGVTNCEFHAGRAETILPQLLKSQKDEKLTVAVVNPARAGLRKDGGHLGCSPCVGFSHGGHQFCVFIPIVDLGAPYEVALK